MMPTKAKPYPFSEWEARYREYPLKTLYWALSDAISARDTAEKTARKFEKDYGWSSGIAEAWRKQAAYWSDDVATIAKEIRTREGGKAPRPPYQPYRANPTVSAMQRRIRESDYPGIFGDPDQDRIPTADDPHPLTPGDVETVEEVSLANEMRELIRLRNELEGVRQDVMGRLKRLAPHGAVVKGRAKTPFSIVNKLRRKRIFGKKGLTDMVGTRIVLPDYLTMREVSDRIARGALGKVVEVEDHYETPGPYRAVHVVVEAPGNDGTPVPVEVQVKTRRQSALADAAHTAYKEGELDEAAMWKLTDLADAADRGDRTAAHRIDAVLSDPRLLERALVGEVEV